VPDDLDLGESDQDEETEFPPPERKVITQSYDLSVQTLVEQWNNETLLLPDIQREYVWENPRASRLIESLLLNIPIPVLYFAETEDAKWEIIDGHQRVRSVVRFLSNEFALSSLVVLSHFNRRRFHQLPEREQRFLERRTMRAVVVTNDSHLNMKFEIFERLNTSAVVLNAQEVRNSLYRGPVNNLLRGLVKDQAFRRAIGTKSPRKRMVDEELILRFFALRRNLRHYRPPLKRFLNDYMASVKDARRPALNQLDELFTSTTARLAQTLDGGAFRLTNAAGRPLESAVNRALFDAQMLAFSWVTDDADLENARVDILERFAELYSQPGFQDAIRRATGDRSRTFTRVRGIVQALSDAGVELDAPALE
jgi:hypothetical protein